MIDGLYDTTLSSEPNTIVKLLKNGSMFVLKIYRRQSGQLLRLLLQKMKERYHFRTKINGQKEFPQSLTVTLEKDAENNEYLRIVTPYMPISHLPIHNSAQLKAILPSLLNELIKNDNSFFYPLNNIFYHQSALRLVNFNLTSNTGLPFVYCQCAITKEEFTEIYELIDPEIFQRKPDERMVFRLKFRALGMVILSFILKKRVSLLFQSDRLPDVLSFNQARQLLQQSRQRFKQLLSNPILRGKIVAAQEADCANYLYFLKRTFVDDCKGLSWSETARLLIFQMRGKSYQDLFTQIAQKMYRHEHPANRHLYQYLGLGHQQDRQLYLLVKSMISLEGLLRYAKIQDYLVDSSNWNLQKQQNCKKLMAVLTENSTYAQRHQRTQAQRLEVQNIEISIRLNNPYEQFKDAFEMIKVAMANKYLRIQGREIRYLTDYQKMIRQYQRL